MLEAILDGSPDGPLFGGSGGIGDTSSGGFSVSSKVGSGRPVQGHRSLRRGARRAPVRHPGSPRGRHPPGAQPRLRQRDRSAAGPGTRGCLGSPCPVRRRRPRASGPALSQASGSASSGRGSKRRSRLPTPAVGLWRPDTGGVKVSICPLFRCGRSPEPHGIRRGNPACARILALAGCAYEYDDGLFQRDARPHPPRRSPTRRCRGTPPGTGRSPARNWTRGRRRCCPKPTEKSSTPTTVSWRPRRNGKRPPRTCPRARYALTLACRSPRRVSFSISHGDVELVDLNLRCGTSRVNVVYLPADVVLTIKVEARSGRQLRLPREPDLRLPGAAVSPGRARPGTDRGCQAAQPSGQRSVSGLAAQSVQ